MPGITRQTTDTAGDFLLTPLQEFVTVEGQLWVVVGTPIDEHGSSPHNNPTMNQGSSFVKINGIAACHAGNTATCGHTSTGSTNMRISN